MLLHNREAFWAMAAQFCAAGIDAAHIDGQMKKAERAEIVEQFRRGAIDILCNVDLISEGFDVPDCSCVIMLRPTQSLTLFIQQAMRCMRYRKGKHAVILDHVGNYARHGMPDDDREWTLEGKPKRKGVKQETAVEEDKFYTCKECYAVFPLKKDGEPVEVCPYCGAAVERKERKAIEQVKETELVQIKGFTVNTKTPEECRSYGELLEYAKMMGYKPGWAWYQAKQRGCCMEHDIQNRIRAAAAPYAVIFRANVGQGYTKDGRFFSTGLPVGFSDLFGFRRSDGRAVFIEVKTMSGRASNEQKHFLAEMRKAGAIAGICRSPEEAIKLIQED